MTTMKTTAAVLSAPLLSALLGGPASSAALPRATMVHPAQAAQPARGTIPFLHGLPTVIRPDVAYALEHHQFGNALGRNRGGANPDAFPWPNFVYTCQPILNDCTKWSPTLGIPPFTQGAPIAGLGTIYPVGTIINTQGQWWIADEKSSSIPHFTGANAGAPVPGVPAILHDPGQLPVDVDANLNGNLVAVANIFTTAGGNGSVSVYRNAGANPATTLTVAGVRQLEGIGIMIDKPGNCFFSYQDLTNNTGHIVEFLRCKGKAIPVPGLPAIGYPGGMAMDGGLHNLYYVDQSVGTVFKCTGEAGPCAAWATGFADPIYINFDPGWAHLWVSDAAMNGGNGELCYTTGGAIPPAQCFTTAANNGDPPVGVAPAPGSLY